LILNNILEGAFEEEKSNFCLIKREIHYLGINNKFIIMIDFIKDEDQTDKILRIFFIENTNDNSETNLNNNDQNINSKSTLVSLFIPIDFYCNMSKTALEEKGMEKFEKEMYKKNNLFKSNLNFLDNIQSYHNNKILIYNKNQQNKPSNLLFLTKFIEEKLSNKQYSMMQTDLSNAILSNFSYQAQSLNYQTPNNNLNSNDLKNQNIHLNDIISVNLNNRKSYDSNVDNRMAAIENMNYDASRKSTLQRFNEIGNRYSFSEMSEGNHIQSYNQINPNPHSNMLVDKSIFDTSNVYTSYMINQTHEVQNEKQPEFINKSEINMNSFLNNTVIGETNKLSLKINDEINNSFSNNNEINFNNTIQNINLTNKVKFEEYIDPDLKKENDEIYRNLDIKCDGLENFLNRDWKKLDEKDGYKSFYFDESSGLRSIKSHVDINRNIRFLEEYLEDINKRGSYDKNFDNGKILRKLDENHSISYLKFKGKVMVSPRDFVVCSRKLIVKI
jgi:hypothetical protein